MELMDLQTVAELLGICTKSVRNLVKRGELQAVYQGTGKKGRPSMMITVSSYGRLILKRGAGLVHVNLTTSLTTPMPKIV